MSKRDDDLTPRPGRIRDKSFVGQVMRAAKKAGHSVIAQESFPALRRRSSPSKHVFRDGRLGDCKTQL
jgi:hypothetical protein